MLILGCHPVRLSIIVAILVSAALVNGVRADDAELYSRLTQKAYIDVMADLRFAIEEANFRITDSNRVGRAISQRERIPFPEATVIHFCSLRFAQRFLEAEPAFLIHMPCRIVVAERGEQVIVEARLVPEGGPGLGPAVTPLAKEMNRLLRSIVDFAAKSP